MKTQSFALPHGIGALNTVEAPSAGERGAKRSPGPAVVPRGLDAGSAR